VPVSAPSQFDPKKFSNKISIGSCQMVCIF
jgi:hypothetical protein